MFREGIAVVKEGNHFLYITPKGDELYRFQDYEYVGWMSQGRARFRKNNEWGYLTPQGTVAIEAQFDDARDFCEGLAAVTKYGRQGFCDPNGKLVIPMVYDATMNFRNGWAPARQKNRWGFIDTSGKWVIIANQWDELYYFQNPAIENP
jgi:hypothetical protein